ncbi:MAG: HEPN domain-containing protein [Candidatus Omnitrophota bacterium]
MPHEDCIPGSPADWLRHAYSDLELARRGRLSDKILLEELCFHAQQAVEKSLKGLLVAKGIAFPKTHNIRILIDILPKDIALPVEIEKSSGLTDYAVMSRYPSALEPVSEEEYQEAVQLSEFVIEWVKKNI